MRGRCAWLIQPNYYYWGRYEATEAQPVRRSGSAEPSSVRRSGSKSVAATKLRARVHKDTGVHRPLLLGVRRQCVLSGTCL